MSAYRYRGFYPAHYDTPTGSRYVRPGEDVDWPDGPPDNWWTAADNAATEEQPEYEPTPAPIPAPATPEE